MDTRKMRWAGTSLVITIPKKHRERKGWTTGTKLEWVDHSEGLLLRQAKKERTLEDILATVTPESMTKEIP